MSASLPGLRQLLTRRGEGMSVMGNLGARLAAVGALTLSTILVARAGGPAWVGILALLRVLPYIFLAVASCGLPGALPYFLAGREKENPHVRSTALAIGAAGSVVGMAAWLVATPLMAAVFMPGLGKVLTAVCALAVLTQMSESTVKAWCQGDGDIPGSNRVIVLEEATYTLTFIAVWLLGLHSVSILVVTRLLSDVETAVIGWLRVWRRGSLRGAARPDLGVARRIVAYGLRGQVGGLLLLANLRLDFLILGAMTNPSVLGVYAVASKFAEILRMPSQALTWVLYPRFASAGAGAAALARRMLRYAGLGVALAAIPLALSAALVIPLLYGSSFHSAVVPALIRIGGLVGDGLVGVITGYLYGRGRPGLNSLAMTGGVVVTAVLDVLLIPHMGATGAAIGGSAAFIATDLMLVACFRWVSRSPAPPALVPAAAGGKP